MWYECSYISRARTGLLPARQCVWSAAHWLTSFRSRGEYVSSTQPEPPPIALPMATNSVSQRPICLTIGSEAVKVQFVQDHRICGDQLFPLEPVDNEHRRRGEV